jgi:hypothetical protein
MERAEDGFEHGESGAVRRFPRGQELG